MDAWPVKAFSVAAVVVIFTGCGGTAHDAATAHTPAYNRGYKIGYNAVLSGTAENCRPRSVQLRNAGRLKTKADVRNFVKGCDTGAADAIRTK